MTQAAPVLDSVESRGLTSIASVIANVLAKYGFLVFIAFVFWVVVKKTTRLIPSLLKYSLAFYALWLLNGLVHAVVLKF